MGQPVRFGADPRQIYDGSRIAVTSDRGRVNESPLARLRGPYPVGAAVHVVRVTGKPHAQLPGLWPAVVREMTYTPGAGKGPAWGTSDDWSPCFATGIEGGGLSVGTTAVGLCVGEWQKDDADPSKESETAPALPVYVLPATALEGESSGVLGLLVRPCSPLGIVDYQYRPACRSICYAEPCIGYEVRVVLKQVLGGCYTETYGPWVFVPGYPNGECPQNCVAVADCSSTYDGPFTCGDCTLPNSLTMRVTGIELPGTFLDGLNCFWNDPNPYETVLTPDPILGYVFDVEGSPSPEEHGGCNAGPEFSPDAPQWGVRGLILCADGFFTLHGGGFCRCGQFASLVGEQPVIIDHDCGPPFYAKYLIRGYHWTTHGIAAGPFDLMYVEFFG